MPVCDTKQKVMSCNYVTRRPPFASIANWHTAELHVTKLLAGKRMLATAPELILKVNLRHRLLDQATTTTTNLSTMPLVLSKIEKAGRTDDLIHAP